MASSYIALALLCTWGRSATGEVNVYGQEMVSCGQDHATGCMYAAGDAGAHEVCVTRLPKGFSSDTGQGPWSDEFTGEPWCICIWAYSNYILQKKDLPLQCEAIPSKVLESRYSLDKFEQCGSMSSTTGCGHEDIRRSIQSLCQQCDAQAGDDTGAKKVLKAKCDAILSAAPAAAMQRLYSDEITRSEGIIAFNNTRQMSLFAFAVLVSVMSVVSVAVTFRKCRSRHNFSAGEAEHTDGEHPVSERTDMASNEALGSMTSLLAKP